MIVKIDKSLEKDLSKIKEKSVLKKLHSVITAIQNSVNLSELKNLKKLKGSANFYRIRIGLIYQNRTCSFSSSQRCLQIFSVKAITTRTVKLAS